MLKGFTHARLACGCRIAFREGVEGSPVTVVVDEKAPGCVMPLHVAICRSTTIAKRSARRRASSRSKKKSTRKKARPQASTASGLLRELHPQLGDERQVVRRHQRQPRPRQLQPSPPPRFPRSRCDRGAGPGTRPDRCAAAAGVRAGRCSAAARSASSWPARGIHSLKSPSTSFGMPTRRSCTMALEPPGLMAPLEERRAQVHVVEMQRVVADGDVDALAAARLARLPGQVVLGVVPDRQPAQHDVAEQAAAQVARRRHHPAHAEQRAELLGVARRAGRRRSPPAARRCRRRCCG